MVAVTQLTRRSAIGGTAALAGALGAACGAGGATGTSGDGGEAPKFKTGSTVVYWNDMGNPYPTLMQRWADTFQQRTGVKVEATGGIGQYADKLGASFAAGAPPDVFRYMPEQIPLPTAVERNVLLKLDPLVKRDKYDLADRSEE